MTLDFTKSQLETFSQLADVGNSTSYINNSFPFIILFGLTPRELKDVITVKCAVALGPLQELCHVYDALRQEDISPAAILIFVIAVIDFGFRSLFYL